MTCSPLSEEVDFLKAELFARNLVAGDAKAAYEAGVRASFETWGVSGDVEEYLASTEKNEAGTSAKYDDQQGAGQYGFRKDHHAEIYRRTSRFGAGSLE